MIHVHQRRRTENMNYILQSTLGCPTTTTWQNNK